jgi:hypothetical protein
VGVKTFATLSDGPEIATPHVFRAEEQPLANVHRRRSSEEKRGEGNGSARRPA